MAITIVATPGSATANSYLTVAEDLAYQETRLFASTMPASGETQKAALVMATRLLDALLSRASESVDALSGKDIILGWTGQATDGVQALCWPRTGMYTRNGYEIASNVIPQALKEAVSEFAHQLTLGDKNLDNDVIVQGITSLKAGPVELGFKDLIEPKVIPDAVLNLMPPTWYKSAASGTGSEFEVL